MKSFRYLAMDGRFVVYYSRIILLRKENNMHKMIPAFIKRNLFLYLMGISLILPDILLRWQSYGFRTDIITGIPSAFTVLWILFGMLALVGFMSRAWGRGIYLGISVFFTVFTVCSYVYFRIFNHFFWLDNIGMTGQAMDYTGYILGYIDARLILFILFEAVLITFTFRLWRARPYRISGLWLIVPLLGLVTLHTFMMTETAEEKATKKTALIGIKDNYRSFKDTNHSMQVAGIYQYVFRNGMRMVFPEGELDPSSLSVADAYFAEKKTESNDMTGLFAGKNVIMVMMESMDDWMISPEYTPTICHMQQNGIQFSNHFACTFGTGYTFNTEFTANTGYHALPAGSPASSLSQNAYPHSIAAKFKGKGYTARSFHFNTPEFYNRGEMHAAFGYDEYISYQKFMKSSDAQQDAKAIKNPKLYRAMVPKQSAPFFDFVITYSAHLPYTYEDEKLENIKKAYPHLIDRSIDEEVNNARILAHDTDEFFRILLENLKKDGLLEDTVIVAFSDHFSYGMSSWEKLYALGDASSSDMLEKAPFFIYCAGMEGTNITKVTSSLDILPTVVNLFDLGKTPYWPGEDAFDPAYPGYVYFSSGAWYDGTLYYLADKQFENYSESRLAYIEEMNRKFYLREKVIETVLRSDYFGEKKEPPLSSIPSY